MSTTPWWEKLLGTFFLLRVLTALKKYMRQTLPKNDDDWWPKEGDKKPDSPPPPLSGAVLGESSGSEAVKTPARTQSGKKNFAKKTR